MILYTNFLNYTEVRFQTKKVTFVSNLHWDGHLKIFLYATQMQNINLNYLT